MKLFTLLLVMVCLPQQSFFDFEIKGIDGKPMDRASFKGKKILIVNTASECGFTPQYKGLEELYEKYKDKLVIIGFPANNFGHQEPGTNEEIASFCSTKFAVSFPMASKISVKGDDMDPLFKWLTNAQNPDFTGDIKWNFEKFLLDEHGQLIHRYRSMTRPMNDELIKAIESNQENK